MSETERVTSQVGPYATHLTAHWCQIDELQHLAKARSQFIITLPGEPPTTNRRPLSRSATIKKEEYHSLSTGSINLTACRHGQQVRYIK